MSGIWEESALSSKHILFHITQRKCCVERLLADTMNWSIEEKKGPSGNTKRGLIVAVVTEQAKI